MKKLIVLFVAATLFAAGVQRASAGGNCGWSTASQVLAGVVTGAVIARAFEPVPVYQTVTYAPAPVVYTAPVYVQPAPVVVYRPAVCAPVYVASRSVCVAPAPVVSFHFGYGHGYHGQRHGRHHRHYR